MSATGSPAVRCPVLSYSPHERRPIGEWAEFFDQLRADAPVVRNTFAEGYYVLTRYEDILGAYQDPETRSAARAHRLPAISHVTTAVIPRMAHMHNFASTRQEVWDVIDDWLAVVTRRPGPARYPGRPSENLGAA